MKKNKIMKKTAISILSLFFCLIANAQYVKLYDADDKLVEQYSVYETVKIVMGDNTNHTSGIKIYKDDGTLLKEFYPTEISKVRSEEYPDLISGAPVIGIRKINGKIIHTTIGGIIANYVDLGLPSGTLWATHNLGASQPSEYGALLGWADIGSEEEGYKNGIKNNYNLKNAKYNSNATKDGYIKYVDEDHITILDSFDDAATVNWGDEWCMPNSEQLKELKEQCTWQHGYYNDVEGFYVTGLNGNQIFLPIASYSVGDSGAADAKIYARYWSSTLYGYGSHSANMLAFSTNELYCGYNGRELGLSVRPVRSKK